MTTKTASTPPPAYMQDPLFGDAMRLFQSAQWTDGLDRLGQLQNRFPDDKELPTLYTEMGIRSKVDQYEREENRRAAMRKVLRGIFLSCAVVLAVTVSWWSITRYATYVQAQVETVRLAAEQSAKELDTFARFRDAQNLMMAGRSSQALAKFREIQQIMPDYPNLDLYIAQAEAMAEVEDEYNRALTLYGEKKYAEALEIFTRINQTIPNYLDVEIRIEELQRLEKMESLLNTANASFDQKLWGNAIEEYTTIHTMDGTYQTTFIDRRLYESHLNLVSEILAQPDATIDRLREADRLYIKALKILPRDEETADLRESLRRTLDQKLYTAYIDQANLKLAAPNPSLLEFSAANALLESALKLRPDDLELTVRTRRATEYVQAVEDYLRSNWSQTIQTMDAILLDDQEYAWGAGIQLVYDSLLERGLSSALNNDPESALSDFQKAERIARMMPNNATALLVARLEEARSLGLVDRTSEAVNLYEDIILTNNLLALANERNPEMYQQLLDAQALRAVDNLGEAYVGYREALNNIVSLMDTVEYNVQAGDYLTWLAHQYGTTSDLIQNVNKLLTRRLDQGDTLTIPYLNTAAVP